MPNERRKLVSQEEGGYHITSHIIDEIGYINQAEKDFFLNLMERLVRGFFVNIHAFCIMSNHFHINLTVLDDDAENATEEELLNRLRLMKGPKAKVPDGSRNGYGIPDPDGGIARLRKRLGSLADFSKELKESFSRWYNRRHKRQGALWRKRYDSVIVQHGLSQLSAGAYTDLNPVRAGIVKKPEQYPYSSLGLRCLDPDRAAVMLDMTYASAINGFGLENLHRGSRGDAYALSWYLDYVYIAGSMDREGKASIPAKYVEEMRRSLDLGDVGGSLCRDIPNFYRGVAVGSQELIGKIQESEGRKFIRPRRLVGGTRPVYVTRRLKPAPHTPTNR